MLDAWKDLYEECIQSEYHMKKQIKEYEKAIEKLKKQIEDNKKFFEEHFDISIDKCIEMSYNEYIKRNKEER